MSSLQGNLQRLTSTQCSYLFNNIQYKPAYISHSRVKWKPFKDGARVKLRSQTHRRPHSTTSYATNQHGPASEYTSNKKNQPEKVTEYPLAVIPNGMLIRSLFVSTISSHAFLLRPSLAILSFISGRKKGVVFNVGYNPILRRLLKSTFYNQFCAGETQRETKNCVQQLKDLGMKGVILTYAKETVFDHQTQRPDTVGFQANRDDRTLQHDSFDVSIEEWRTGTLETVEMISEGDILALKTTGAGANVTAAFSRRQLPPQQMLDALDEIGSRCKERGIRIIVDAESQHFQHGIARTTLDMMRKFNTDGVAVIYNTYQAYLKATPQLIADHLDTAQREGFTLGLKLVRGAYMLSDDRSLIHDTKQDTDDAYNSIAMGALCQHIGDFGGSFPLAQPFPSVCLFLASHNRDSVIRAQRLHTERCKQGLPTVPLAFGQLHGMSDEVSFSLLQEKTADGQSPDVYKCSTWGSLSQCLAYLLRRAVENRDAVSRTSDEHAALTAEVGRRMRGLFWGSMGEGNRM